MFKQAGFEQGGLEHGGKLREAARQYGRALDEWLDLSTGINPNGWPVPTVPAECWSRLPEEGDGLEQAARIYYGAEQLLAVAGSQAAIQTLPWLRSRSRVAILTPGYNEHAHAWQRAGHQLTPVSADSIEATLAQQDVVVLIHPNNPTGACFSPEQLLAWHQQLAARGGWLVVDEAFMDTTPGQSLCRYSTRPGLIVLRSLGKFFGLAGVRVGFVVAEPSLLQLLADNLGPWTLAGPSRYIANMALQDLAWQQRARLTLQQQSERLMLLLARYGLAADGGTALFQWVRTEQAAFIHHALANEAILIRLFKTPASLRFGLPGNEQEWRRLEQALESVK